MTDHNVSHSGGLSPSSLWVVREAKVDQSDAWVRLVNRYGEFVYRQCRRSGLQPSCAQDVMQEVFLAVARKLGDFQHEGPEASFRGWLKTITERKIYDRARRLARSPKVEGGSDAHERWMQLAHGAEGSTSQASATAPETHRVRVAMQRLRDEVGERNWLIFSAVVLDGVSTEEAMEQFQVTSNVIYLAKSRSLRRLRELLRDEPDARSEVCPA